MQIIMTWIKPDNNINRNKIYFYPSSISLFLQQLPRQDQDIDVTQLCMNYSQIYEFV